MVRARDSGSSGPYRVVFLGKILHPPVVTLHPGV